MAYSFITPENISKRYTEAKVYTDQLTQPFPEFARIARNRPFPGIDPAYPKTTDGTTASIIQKTPKRVVQQLPTGIISSDEDGTYLPIVAQFIYTHKIIPYANEDYGLFEKSQLIIENGLTFGSGASYAPFLNHDGYFCPDLTLPYWGDIFLQKGKKSGYACSYVFIRAWWQKADVEALIDSEKKLAAQAKKRGDKYEPTWDIEALKKVLDAITAKDQKARTPTEDERNGSPEGIELVTAFQKGVGAKFYTFNPGSKEIVRTKVNKDPRGKIPIDWFYGDIDGNNPLGRGIVELVGGLQNLIDSDMQAYQYNRALALQPPVIKYGNIGDFTFAPNVVIDAANDPNAKIVPLVIDTSALVNYPQLYGLQKSQLLNLVNSPDTSISSTVGNPSFSKTDAGVKSQNASVSVDDNAVRKRFESWFQNWSETAINLYFGERTGKEELQLDQQTAQRLRELPNFDQTMLSDDNKILIDYDTATPALKFKVDPSTTAVADKSAQVQDATALLDLVMKYPMLNVTYGGPIDTEVLARRIVNNSGIDDPEQVAPEPTEAQRQAKEQAKNQVSPFSPMFDKPSIRMNFPDLPPAAQVQVLANAGVHVSMEDIMQGPVVDPNMRGVMNPVNDPNVLLPGQQPGQPQGVGANPIDLGDIYKGTTDPTVKAQIEAMAGLKPDINHVANQAQTTAFTHASDQATAVSNVTTPPQQVNAAQASDNEANPQDATEPNEATEPSEPKHKLTPQDIQLIHQMKQLGISDAGIQQAMTMLEQGADEHQVLQMITQGAQ